MEDAVVTLRVLGPLDDDLVDRLLERTNTATAGPPLRAQLEGERVTFTCATWRPILVARLDAAVEAELGAEQTLLAPHPGP